MASQFWTFGRLRKAPEVFFLSGVAHLPQRR
jgi:hypothetical protein